MCTYGACRNVPGVLRDLNTMLESYNVLQQQLSTTKEIGYAIIDVDKVCCGIMPAASLTFAGRFTGGQEEALRAAALSEDSHLVLLSMDFSLAVFEAMLRNGTTGNEECSLTLRGLGRRTLPE